MIVYKCDLCGSEFRHNNSLPPINIYIQEDKKENHITENINHVCVKCRFKITEFITTIMNTNYTNR